MSDVSKTSKTLAAAVAVANAVAITTSDRNTRSFPYQMDTAFFPVTHCPPPPMGGHGGDWYSPVYKRGNKGKRKH